MSEIKWNIAKLEVVVDTAERKILGACATHYTRAAQDMISVSAGGRSRRARAIRRTRGNVTKGPLGKIFHGVLDFPSKYNASSNDGSSLYTDEKASPINPADFSPRVAAKAATDEYEKFRHSKPGEPPRKITGFLQRNVTWKFVEIADQLVSRAGLFRNAIYGAFLELGFRTRRTKGRGVYRVLPRPWMGRTFRQELPNFGAIAERYRG